ncbi:MAG: hypothetical protein GY716_08660 [bacterium]|nr:hypothetical protein [bacterium]
MLIDLASTGSSNEAMLARAVLGLARQVGRLSHSVFDSTGPNAVGTLHQLSGGGGLLSSSAALQPGEQLDLRMWDEDPQVPPIRMLAEIVRVDHPTPGPFPLRFTAIHPQDRERLIRYLYEVQRRALREARTAAD